MKISHAASCLHTLSALVALTVLPMQAGADTFFMTFANSGGASGNINGTSFSAANWALEYQIDNTALDNNPGNVNSGSFMGAITAANFKLNEITYTLANGAEAGNVYLSNHSTAYDGVSINPTSGGYMQFITNYGTVFPALFSDNNNLSTANLGTKIFDTTTDSYNNQSIINYQNRQDMFTGLDTGGIYTSDGDIISIYENSGAASGNFSVAVSASSSLVPAAEVSAVPVPAAVWLFGSGLLGMVGAARRKRS